MHITISYMAQVKQAAGVSTEAVELADGSTVRDLLNELAARRGAPLRQTLLADDGKRRRSILVFVGEELVSGDDRQLRDRDEVTLISPVAGG